MTSRCAVASCLLALTAGCIPLPEYGDEGEPCFKNGTCKEGLECIEDVCTGCTPRCENLCSPAPDGCGGQCPGPCPGGTYCDAGDCLVCDNDAHCGAQCQDCTSGGGTCLAQQCCYPDCTGRACGPDGCGGDCGGCQSGESCNQQTGQCIPNARPQIEWDDIGGARFSPGTRQAAFSVRFSEAVTGVGTGGATIDGGAFLSGFTTRDGVTWTFEVAAVHNGGSYTISFNENIRDDLRESLVPTTRGFLVEVGTVMYVTPDGTGSGASPADPTNLINALVTAGEGTDILAAQGTYTTFIELVPGVGLFCGFSSNFQQRDPQNYQTIIEQGTLYATASTYQPEAGVRRIIDGCVIETSYGSEPSMAVDVGLGASPIISQCAIRNYDAPRSIGIRVQNSGASILNNTLQSNAAAETTDYAGILLSAADDPRIFGNRVDAGDGPGPSVGLSGSMTGGRIWQNVFFGGGGAGPGSPHPGAAIKIDGGSPSIVNNQIHGGTNKATTSGISCGPGSALIAHNTVYSGDGSTQSTALGILDDGANPVVVNNILFGSAGGICIREMGAAADPSSCQNNLLFGCGQGLYLDEGSDAYTTPADIDNLLHDGDIQDGTCTLDVDCETSRFGGNLTFAGTPAELFVDFQGLDWHLNTNEPGIIGSGKGTFGGDCGSQESPVSCGEVSMDLDGAWRNTPVTPGAYERD